MARDAQLLQIISRFGLPLGVGDKTVDEVCRQSGIHTRTFLAVANHVPSTDIDVPTLMIYLRNAHAYFLDYQLPRIRQELLDAISRPYASVEDNKIPLLIIQFYDEYVEEIRTHIRHEDENAFLLHEDDDMHVAQKLSELKNLIIRYYPAQDQNAMLYAALQDIFLIEQELSLHCSIEDDILLPAMNSRPQSEALSDREKDVLIQVAKGLSNKEIADKLHLSAHTVISHRKNIARKLGIHSAAGLTIYAVVNHLIELPN